MVFFRSLIVFLFFNIFFGIPVGAIDQKIPNPPQNENPPKIASSCFLPQVLLTGIPDVMQMNDYSCGVGVFQAVAAYFGYWGYQKEFSKSLGTTQKQGTHPRRIEKGLKKLGFEVRLVENMTLDQLRNCLRQGEIVIIDFQAWGDEEDQDYSNEWEEGHYCVVVGFNEKYVFLEDPSLLGTIGYLSNEELLSRWHDYEIENGKPRKYYHMGIIIRGKQVPQPMFTHID